MKEKEEEKPKFYIRSKPFPRTRGKAGCLPDSAIGETIFVDVTSGQKRDSVNRISFSPMHSGAPYVTQAGKKYLCYEHYWQSKKVHEGCDHADALKWWEKQTKPKRRLPGSRGRKVLHAVEETRYPGKKFGYVESRKAFYLKDYRHKIRNCAVATLAMAKIRKQFQTKNVVITDYDGPRDASGQPTCELVTIELLRQKLHDVSNPFGHGYIVAAELLGIPDSAFVSPSLVAVA